MSQKTSNVKRSSVYDYDALTDGIFRLIRKDTSVENSILIEKYDRMMEYKNKIRNHVAKLKEQLEKLVK